MRVNAIDAGNSSKIWSQSIFEPSQNIEGGVRYLKDLLQFLITIFDLLLLLTTQVKIVLNVINDIPNFLETQNYVRKVMALYSGEMKYTPYGQEVQNG